MFGWLEALMVALFAGIVVIIIIFLLIRRRFSSKQNQIQTAATRATSEAKTVPFHPEVSIKRRPSYHIFRRGSSTEPFFNWADHPALITDAVENGWSLFAFTNYVPFPSVRSSLFGSLRATGDYYLNQVEITSEVALGSVDFMQKIHFKINGSNPITTAAAATNSSAAKSTVRMALPLPGPPQVNSFPKEAYFEITVLKSPENNGQIKGGEGEKTKLLVQQNNNSSSCSSTSAVIGNNNSFDSLVHVSSTRGAHLLEDLKIGGGKSKRGGREEGGSVKMSLGLTVGGSGANKMPGSYAGSIGFNSDGSVYLAGMKLVFESEKEDWAQTGKIVGCGFDPSQKKVFFTVDSELIHVIHCKSEDFGVPLYPVLVANIDITVLVNLGQSSFSYSPANVHRTPNPCFIGPVVHSSAAAALGYEDSRELFSMGRINDDWLSPGVTIKSTVSNSSNNNNNNNNSKMAEFDDESETEFFEIVLDSTSRSSSVA